MCVDNSLVNAIPLRILSLSLLIHLVLKFILEKNVKVKAENNFWNAFQSLLPAVIIGDVCHFFCVMK